MRERHTQNVQAKIEIDEIEADSDDLVSLALAQLNAHFVRASDYMSNAIAVKHSAAHLETLKF